jgi:hypothetical protein
MEKISIYIGIALASTVKFVGGPLAGVALSENWTITALLSAAGMMISVLCVLFLGQYFLKLAAYFRKGQAKKFTKTSRYAVKTKQRLGLWGIAFLTPFIFTPILGSFLSLSFKYPKSEIITKMLICGVFAGYVQTIAVYYFKDIVLHFLNK